MAALLLILHLLGVAIWLGGSVSVGMIWMRSLDQDDSTLLAATGNVRWMSRFIAMPASIVVLLAGGALVTAADWDFSLAWIHLGTGLLLAAALVGVVVVGSGDKTADGFSRLGSARREFCGPYEVWVDLHPAVVAGRHMGHGGQTIRVIRSEIRRLQ